MSDYSHSNPVNSTIRKYENHPSVKKIREAITITSTFHFSGVDKAEKCLKVTSDICNPSLAAIWNQDLILNRNFPQKFKLAE